MPPLIEPHRRQFRDILEEKMPPEGADAVLAALPASEAEMPATKDFVRAEISDLRADTTEKFANADAKMNDKFAAASTELKHWVIGTGIALGGAGIALAGVLLAAINTLPS